MHSIPLAVSISAGGGGELLIKKSVRVVEKTVQDVFQQYVILGGAGIKLGATGDRRNERKMQRGKK
jgi:hypothetical protein